MMTASSRCLRTPGHQDESDTGQAVRHLFIFAPDGTRLHALDYGGSGQPILLLHGVTGHAWLWARVAPSLTDMGRVIALDFRGHGDSQWSAPDFYNTEQYADDVRTVLYSIGAERVDLVGLSWGGLVGVHLAATDAELVRSLTLLDVPLSSGLSADDVPDRPRTFADHAEVRAWEKQANPHAPGGLIDLIACHGARPSADGRLSRCHDPYFESRWPFRRDDRRGEFAGLTVPTLLVHGEDSPVLSHDASVAMRRLLPALRIEHLTDCGHLVPVEAPGRVEPLIRDLIVRPVRARDQEGA